MKLAKKVIKTVNEVADKRGVQACDGLYVMFYRLFTEFNKENGKLFFKTNKSFMTKGDQAEVVALAGKFFAGIDFTREQSELASDSKVKKAHKEFIEAVDKLAESELERYGLGKAPFKFLGALSAPDKSVQEQNPEAYNNALREFPRFDAGGIGSCARCYNHITDHYIIKSSDGKIFPLGADCVHRLNDKKLTTEAEKAEKKVETEKRKKRETAKKDELKDILDNPDHIKTLKAIPLAKHAEYNKWPDSKKAWWDDKFKNQTTYDNFVHLAKVSGTAGKVRLLKELKKMLGLK